MEGTKNKGRVAFLHERVFPPRSLKREADDESRSAAAGLDKDRTLVLFDNLFGDEETETCAAITFGGEKRFKNPIDVSGRDAGAGVRNRDSHRAAFGSRHDREHPLAGLRH